MIGVSYKIKTQKIYNSFKQSNNAKKCKNTLHLNVCCCLEYDPVALFVFYQK